MTCKITEGEAEIAYQLAVSMPEFTDPLPRSKFKDRTHKTNALILVVYTDDKPVGFKIGYHRNDSYYSWLGGVLPTYRKKGLAKMMARHMENRVRSLGYLNMWMKTRNRFKEMLQFAIRNDFDIVDVQKAEHVGDHRIILEKKL